MRHKPTHKNTLPKTVVEYRTKRSEFNLPRLITLDITKLPKADYTDFLKNMEYSGVLIDNLRTEIIDCMH